VGVKSGSDPTAARSSSGDRQKKGGWPDGQPTGVKWAWDPSATEGTNVTPGTSKEYETGRTAQGEIIATPAIAKRTHAKWTGGRRACGSSVYEDG